MHKHELIGAFVAIRRHLQRMQRMMRLVRPHTAWARAGPANQPAKRPRAYRTQSGPRRGIGDNEKTKKYSNGKSAQSERTEKMNEGKGAEKFDERRRGMRKKTKERPAGGEQVVLHCSLAHANRHMDTDGQETRDGGRQKR